MSEGTLTERESVALVAAEWERIGLATGIGDHDKAEAAIIEAYKRQNEQPPPVIVWAKSVKEGLLMSARAQHGLKPTDHVTGAQLRQALGEVAYSQPDAPWLARVDWVLQYAKPTDEDPPDSLKRRQYKEAVVAEPLLEVANHVSWYWPYDEMCILTDRPTVLTLDDAGDLHNETGPAMAWSDGYALYFWHGVAVPGEAIEHPETYPTDKVFSEPNTEVRRALIEKIGWDRLAEDLGLKEVQRDRWGILLKAGRRVDSEALVLVKMVNSTPEGHYERVPEGRLPRVLVTHKRDGSELRILPQLVNHAEFVLDAGPHGEEAPYYKEYVNRVPPRTKTAHEGLAWSFNMTTKEYQPEIET